MKYLAKEFRKRRLHEVEYTETNLINGGLWMTCPNNWNIMNVDKEIQQIDAAISELVYDKAH